MQKNHSISDRCFGLRCCNCIALVMLILAGCNQDRGSNSAEPARKPSDEFNSYFEGWLKAHGEKEIVSARDGVSISGKPVLFSAKTYDEEQSEKSGSVEIEFTTTLPDKRIITDFVAGMGADVKAAKGDAIANFTLTTVHVLYSALVNDKDPHLQPETHDVKGKPRQFYIGGWGIRAQSPLDQAVLDKLTKHVVNCITELDLDEKTHWVKVVYGQNKGKMIVSETTLDNVVDARLDAAIDKAPWPTKEDFYMLKLFILIK
jgi:hypothetical protein